MSNIQQQAIATFSTMLSRAIAYRENPSENDELLFKPRYGICDNIGRCSPNGTSHDTMSLIKDNVIRRVPSYSGNYHYPVRHPNPENGVSQADAAEHAYDNYSQRFEGEYGAERVKQLTEILDYVTNQWDDKLAERQSPASRIGIIKGLTIVKRRDDQSMWVLHSDDDSADPYFLPLGSSDRDDRCAISLHRLEVLPIPEINKISVSSFVKRMIKAKKKREELEKKLKAIHIDIAKSQQAEQVLAYHLGKQHGVQILEAA